ncbi:hypothetical protein FD755_021515, partial [Muntiacus reevesi]
KTAENFHALYTGEKSIGPTTGKPLRFKGCPLHGIIKKLMIQGGDFSNQNGTGGESICGEKLEGENFHYKHDKEGLLSMANAGSNIDGSQSFITTVLTPHLDGKHVVKGEKPAKLCVIAECRELKEGDDWEIFPRDGSCDSHPDFPEDVDVDLKDALEIDPSNTKALYHRAQGWQGLKEYVQALDTQKDKEKAAYAKMFA